jgi:hypothetical protein
LQSDLALGLLIFLTLYLALKTRTFGITRGFIWFLVFQYQG